MNNHNTQEIIYTCPMHPEVRQDRQGMCPECGMALVPMKKKKREEHSDHKKAGDENFDKHSGHSVNIFKAKFWVSFYLVYSGGRVFRHRGEAFWLHGSAIFRLAISSACFILNYFLLWRLRFHNFSLSGTAGETSRDDDAYRAGNFGGLFLQRCDYFSGRKRYAFWELATLITIMLLGHWIEMRAVSGAQSALKELSKLLPDTAEVMRNGKVEIVSLSELKKTI